MAELIANHICKNPNCTKGTDGGRKKFYACKFCDKTQNWRSVACSFECYQEYMDLVIAERSKNKKVDVLPERLDMSTQEVEELMDKPYHEVYEETKEELKEYIGESEINDFSEIVDEINYEINKKKINTVRSKKKKEIIDEQI